MPTISSARISQNLTASHSFGRYGSGHVSASAFLCVDTSAPARLSRTRKPPIAFAYSGGAARPTYAHARLPNSSQPPQGCRRGNDQHGRSNVYRPPSLHPDPFLAGETKQENGKDKRRMGCGGSSAAFCPSLSPQQSSLLGPQGFGLLITTPVRYAGSDDFPLTLTSTPCSPAKWPF